MNFKIIKVTGISTLWASKDTLIRWQNLKESSKQKNSNSVKYFKYFKQVVYSANYNLF